MNIVEKRREMLINITFFAVVTVLYALFLKYAFWIVAPFIIAFVVALILQKPIRLISKKTKIKRSIVGAVSVFLILTAIVTVIVLVGYRLVSEFRGLGSYIVDKLHDLPELIRSVEGWIISHIAFLPDSIEKSLADTISGFISNILLYLEQGESAGGMDLSTEGFDLSLITTPLGGLISTAKHIPAVLAAALISIIACFFVTCDYDSLTNLIKNNISEEHEALIIKVKRLFGDIIGKMVKSYATIIFVTFCEITIGLNILKLIGVYNGGYIIAISVGTAILDILPVFGTGTVLIPWAVVSLFSGNIGLGIGLIVIYGLITVIRQILEPRLVAMNVGLPPIVTLAGMYLGLQLFGMIGLFALPITFVMLKVLNEEGIIHLWTARSKINGENDKKAAEKAAGK
ncbi:MAG: sporulation integral membrane protein YtvI [Clostridia bacterium]|nr:sporulation integral membrane protein YtvI [Clostridia bacterium]